MRYGLYIWLLMCNEWIRHSSLAIWLFTVLVDRRQYEAVMIRNRKYKIQTDVSNFNPSGTWPKLPTVSHFCLVHFCWFFSFGLFNTSEMLIFQRVWSCVDSPLLGVACYIENSMKEAWLLASFQCYATFSLSGGLAEMFSTFQKYQIVSCGDWRSKSNITTSFTDSPIGTTSKSKQSFSEMCLKEYEVK